MTDLLALLREARDELDEHCYVGGLLDEIDAAIAEREAAQVVPEGWVLVPVLPTKEMCRAFNHRRETAGNNGPYAVWAAMLSAAQAVPQGWALEIERLRQAGIDQAVGAAKEFNRAEAAEHKRDELRAQLEAAQRDAERYRWLRDKCPDVENLLFYSFDDHPTWDGTIDEAMAKDAARAEKP